VSPATPHPRILVTRRLPQPVEVVLRARYQAELNAEDRQLSREELSAALREFDIVLCTLTDALDRGVFDGAPPRTKLLANFGAGTNHIDLPAASAVGLTVTNTPGVLTDDTADLTILLMLAVARGAWAGDRELRAGAWRGWAPTHALATRVTGKTVGIVGFGRIGQAVARRAHSAFGMSIQYVSRGPAPPDVERRLLARRVSRLDELADSVDFLSVHCPATPETRHLISREVLAALRPSAYLINTARGDLVDEGALIEALTQRRIAGAGLDVYEHEPRVPDALLALPNVVTLPHLGSATHESRVAMGMCVVDNIARFLAGEAPPNLVCAPARLA
jgi:lactate dehydrogenase-like 2-hydroxyacid dehydrogenase